MNVENKKPLNLDGIKYVQKIKKELSKAGNLLYQYRPCRRDESTIYDIENIRHNVVYAQTPLNMNDPFDSRVGFSPEKIYDEIINMVLEIMPFEQNVKQVLGYLLEYQLLGKFAEFISALNELKKHIIFQRKAMHKENLSFISFLSTYLNQVFNGLPKNVKSLFNKEAVKIFGVLISSLENTEITEENLKRIAGFDEQLETLKKVILEMQNDKYIPALKKFLSSMTISCFSASGWQNALMWSHYANSYAGFCVEYDFNKMTNFIGFVEKIEYSRTRPTISLKDIGISGLQYVEKEDGTKTAEIVYAETNLEKVLEYITVKDTCWKYEEEWRIINIGEPNTPYFIEMPEIKSITFGLNIDYLCKQLLWDVCKEKNIPCYELILNSVNFSIDRKLLSAQDVEFDIEKECKYITLLCNSYVKNSNIMIEKAQTITKMLEDKSYDSALLIETDKSVIDCLTDSYFIKSSIYRLLNKYPEVADIFITESVINGIKQLNRSIESNKLMIEEQKKMLVSFALQQLISFQDYKTLCQLVFKMDSLVAKIESLTWHEKLIKNL